MFLIESIRRNLWLISYHFNIWILKVAIVFLAFTPLFNDQSCISYLSQLVLQSDTAGIIGAFDLPIVQFPILLGVMIILISLLLFFIDTLFEAGFLSTYLKKKKKYFWSSINLYCKKLFKINGLCFIPKIAVFASMIVIFDTIYKLDQIVESLIFIGSSFTLLFYLLRVLDSIKLNYVLKNKGLKVSFINGFKGLMVSSKNDWLLNMSYGFCLTLMLMLFFTLEKTLELRFSDVVLLAVSFQQFFVLIRQIARYTYLGAVISLEFNKKYNVVNESVLELESI